MEKSIFTFLYGFNISSIMFLNVFNKSIKYMRKFVLHNISTIYDDKYCFSRSRTKIKHISGTIWDLY